MLSIIYGWKNIFRLMRNLNRKVVTLLKKNFDSFLVAKAEKQQELIIQSDKQSEINDVIYAEVMYLFLLGANCLELII